MVELVEAEASSTSHVDRIIKAQSRQKISTRDRDLLSGAQTTAKYNYVVFMASVSSEAGSSQAVRVQDFIVIPTSPARPLNIPL